MTTTLNDAAKTTISEPAEEFDPPHSCSLEQRIWSNINVAGQLVSLGATVVGSFMAGWAHAVNSASSTTMRVAAIALAISAVIVITRWALRLIDLKRPPRVEERLVIALSASMAATLIAVVSWSAFCIWLEVFVAAANSLE